MDRKTELLLLENNELINLSDEEATYLDSEALSIRNSLIRRFNQLKKEVLNEQNQKTEL
jgi:hypothetical protein